MIESPQNEWIATAVSFLEAKSRELPADERPDSYWADDVVAGIVASVRAVIGIDELQARTEARYSSEQGSGVRVQRSRGLTENPES
jgi:hypothetical protein